MSTSYTSLLGLALPVTGELSGTWGDEVNNYITQYLDASVAGTQTISGSQTAVTLSKTTNASLSQAGSGATGSSQYQIINCTGNPAGLLTITVPAASKAYLVLNNTSTSQSVKIVGAGPTTGVTIASAQSALVAWNGTDFELVGTTDASKLTGVLAAINGGTGQSSYAVGDLLYASSTTALSKLADVATGNALISGGVSTAPSYGKIGLTTHISGTLAVGNGGTGVTSGTSGGVPYFSGTTTIASSAALAANALVVGGGAGSAPSTVTTGTGVVTALGVNTGSAGAFVVNGGALGTPSSGTVTNLTGTASININGTVGATTPNTGAFTSVTSTSEVVTGASGIKTLQAATQDGVQLLGRAGGTSSYLATITPTTLTASRTVTLPDASTTVPVATQVITFSGPTAARTYTFPDANTTVLTTNAAVTVAQGGTGATTLTGLVKGNGTSAFTAAVSGTDYAPATSGTSILYGNGSGGFSNVTVGSGISFVGGTLSASGSGGTVTSVGWTGGIVSVANGTTTPAFTIAGTSGGIPYFSSASTWATSAALAANSLVVGGGAGVAPSTITTGTGVITALGTAVGSAGAFVVNGGALGTPSSGTLTNATGLPLTTGVTGTLPVANGGTGATTLTGIVKGSGTSAFSAATAGTDYVAPGTATTFTALQTFSGSTSVAAAKLANAKEVCTISATAATGTIAYDVTTQSVLYYTSNASANWTVNFRGSSGTSLDTLMSTGESMTVAFLVTQGATAYYNSAVQVDGNSVTPKYQGGTAWSAGNASGVDAYVYTIVKTGSATFTVFASQTQFK